ncbi:MAG: hypothetical protein ACLGIB_08140 [Actinomycetota bacterium]
MKKIVTLLASLALVASGLHLLPAAAAEEAPEVPAVVQIEDPLNDGNFLNDQGNRDKTGFQGDKATPADGSTVGDLLRVWFTNDSETVSVHFQTEKPGPATTSIAYQAYTNAGEGSAGSNALGCLRWYGLIPGASNGQSTTYQGPPLIKLVDRCNDGTSVYSNGVEGKHAIVEGPEGTGILTLTFPRAYSPILAGPSLTAPFASTTIVAGAEAVGNTGPLMIDNTANGTDYVMVESNAGTPGKTPPGKNPIPGKKKGCDNGKGKKRGCEGKGKKSPKPGPPSAQCAPFTPGEAGKDQPTVVLTDSATEAKPFEQTITLEESAADADLFGTGVLPASHSAFNIQVDSKAAEAGLYALVEFPARNDYDLNLLHTDGSYAARSRAFNPIIELNDVPIGPVFPNGLSATGHGGESTASSEKLVGIKTSDCGGWTLDVANYLGMGGDTVVKLWLGEVKIDPQEPGAETP